MDNEFCETAIVEGTKIENPPEINNKYSQMYNSIDDLAKQNLYVNTVQMLKYLTKLKDQYKMYKEKMFSDYNLIDFNNTFNNMENKIKGMYAPISGGLRNKRIRRQKTKRRRRSSRIRRL